MERKNIPNTHTHAQVYKQNEWNTTNYYNANAINRPHGELIGLKRFDDCEVVLMIRFYFIDNALTDREEFKLSNMLIAWAKISSNHYYDAL